MKQLSILIPVTVFMLLCSNALSELAMAKDVVRPEEIKSMGIIVNKQVETAVHFKTLPEDEISTYIKSGNPFDKAGAYGIQDYSGIFVDKIEGCFYNVVGFPLSDFNASLKGLLSDHNLEFKTKMDAPKKKEENPDPSDGQRKKPFESKVNTK